MATVKLILRTERTNKSGEAPLYIRMIKDRKPQYISLNFRLPPSSWNQDEQKIKSSYPNSTRLNHFIVKKLAEANDKLLELESEKEQVTAQLVTSNIKDKSNISTFFELAAIYLDQLESQGQLDRLSGEKARVKHFRAFLNHRDITAEYYFYDKDPSLCWKKREKLRFFYRNDEELVYQYESKLLKEKKICLHHFS